MPRIAGVELPAQKRIEAALPYLYGIGPSLAQKILSEAKVSPDIRVKNLSEAELKSIQDAIRNYTVEGDLRREIQMNIKRLIDISSYRGSRHKKSLPVRGQRTRTNARTRKGPRKTVGIVRKKEERRALRKEVKVETAPEKKKEEKGKEG